LCASSPPAASAAQVSAAYDVLSDPEKRKIYDQARQLTRAVFMSS